LLIGSVTGLAYITTEQKNQELAEQQVVEAITIRVIADDKGVVVSLSDGAEAFFQKDLGYERSEVLGHSIGDFMPESLREYHQHQLSESAEIKATTNEVKIVVCTMQAKDGKQIPASIEMRKVVTGDSVLFVANVVKTEDIRFVSPPIEPEALPR